MMESNLNALYTHAERNYKTCAFLGLGLKYKVNLLVNGETHFHVLGTYTRHTAKAKKRGRVCVCVRERERERKNKGKKMSYKTNGICCFVNVYFTFLFLIYSILLYAGKLNHIFCFFFLFVCLFCFVLVHY